ncbi:MAG: dockerin type I domain-containing protein [Bacteroidaceae bacterium]|nr:dockerin type I domain-containing protein [Bacteroidaceae bacterium]
MKKKIFGIILVLVVALSIFSTTAMAAQLGRCPLCGEENAMVWYNEDYGYCYKCHRSTDTVSLQLNIKSDELRLDTTEITVYKNGKIERLGYFPSGEQTALFNGLQKGFYTVCINMNGYMPVVYNVWLYSDQDVNFNLHLRGDVNSDGIVNANDYNMIKNYLNHRGWLYGMQYQYADVNGDWRVNNKDLEILKLSVFG